MDKEKKSAKTYSNPTSLEKLIKENKPTEPVKPERKLRSLKYSPEYSES